MQDLNDLRLFSAVVTHKGFSSAAKVLGMPKSRLSKRVARLEEQLGVRLIERSTRRMRVTDVGLAFFEKCEAVLSSVEAAEAVIADALSEPKGIVRVSCPVALAQTYLAAALPSFAARYPLVRIEIRAINRAVDPIGERIDVALRARNHTDTDPELMMRVLGHGRSVIAASPAFIAQHGPITFEMLGDLPALSPSEEVGRETWHLLDANGRSVDVTANLRMACNEFNLIRMATIAGIGVALLPDFVCKADFASGALVRVLPDWSSPKTTMYLVFPTRRGLPPAVRAFIDHLAAEFPPLFDE